MPFITAPGIEGQLYIPEEQSGNIRKHNCEDCASCMICNDDKCTMCRGQRGCVEKSNSHTENNSEDAGY